MYLTAHPFCRGEEWVELYLHCPICLHGCEWNGAFELLLGVAVGSNRSGISGRSVHYLAAVRIWSTLWQAISHSQSASCDPHCCTVTSAFSKYRVDIIYRPYIKMNYVKSLVSKGTRFMDLGKKKMEKTMHWGSCAFPFTSFVLIQSYRIKWWHTIQDVEDRDHWVT